ncbi:hypothetical protein AC792_11835 [Arthrobacter sp. RIT-PI-e]|uniref:hypothetical protein n=1 Tax=Arthrobacter sp. RIT-PI-e TaxID=1681197 RepID=UPI000675D3DD|nr:hypothetical protein [Arthrobacter sp. RIT-PI-e]KNC18502.1 hypothetical protein AC792_11835 [Arthrobacter sp. RIT-PI-e]
MTASHSSPLPTDGSTTRCAARSRTTPRVLSTTIGALLLTGALAGAAPAPATDAVLDVPQVNRQLPGAGVAPPPTPPQTSGDPVPPIEDPTAVSGVDPATGLDINARTGFLVHPPTGYLIEPGTGNLLFADSLIYTNLRYDELTGEVVVIEGESPVPPASAPEAAGPAPTAGPTATPSGQAGGTAEPTASAAPSASATVSALPTTPAVDTVSEAVPAENVPDAAGTSSATATQRPTRAATPPASASAAVLADDERTSVGSMTPATWIGAGVLAAVFAVGGFLVGRRRGHHQV